METTQELLEAVIYLREYLTPQIAERVLIQASSHDEDGLRALQTIRSVTTEKRAAASEVCFLANHIKKIYSHPVSKTIH